MTNDNDTLRLLNKIHNGSQLTIDTAKNIDEAIKYPVIKNDLSNIAKEHQLLNSIIRDEMHQYSANPTGIKMHEKALAKLSVKAKLVHNNDMSSVANMMMEASESGIAEIYDAIRSYPHASEMSKVLADNYISIQKHHIDSLLNYLDEQKDEQ